MAIGAYEVKRGESARPLRAQLADADGPILIQTAAVELGVRSMFDATVAFEGDCVVADDGTDENRGRVEFWWTPDFWGAVVPGLYYAEFKIRFSPDTVDEQVTYVPSDGYDVIEVLAPTVAVDWTAPPSTPAALALETTARIAGDVAVKAQERLGLAGDPDSIISGTIVRDANGAATSAPVTWPDGTVGVYTAVVLSTAFPGAVDSYTITYGSTTYTQPTVTRDVNGAVVLRPVITVS